MSWCASSSSTRPLRSSNTGPWPGRTSRAGRSRLACSEARNACSAWPSVNASKPSEGVMCGRTWSPAKSRSSERNIRCPRLCPGVRCACSTRPPSSRRSPSATQWSGQVANPRRWTCSNVNPIPASSSASVARAVAQQQRAPVREVAVELLAHDRRAEVGALVLTQVDRGAGELAQVRGEPVVVVVRVGGDDRGQVAQPRAERREAVGERGEDRVAAPARVDSARPSPSSIA